MTNQQTETKPFRSLADVYRERGLCECGCGGRASSEMFDPHFSSDILGARYALACSDGGHEGMQACRNRIRKNRSTPAPETGGAKPVEETDEQWIGVRVRHRGVTSCGHGTVRSVAGANAMVYWDVWGKEYRAHLANLIPIKDSPAGVGSAEPVRARHEPKAAAPKAVEPTLAEPSVWGIPRPVEQPKREPCAKEGCRCVYCKAAGDGVGLDRRVADADFRRSMDNPTRHDIQDRELAARQRLALMDKRERPRLTANGRELALPHPWECPDD